MGAIVNGMAVHGGLLPYGGTFLVFSDYMRGAIRLSALSAYHSIWVLTHDSIGVGEDGPTHQPVEHVTSLRLIPDLITIRPSDANETAQAWRFAIQHKGPVALVLTRQNTATIDRQLYTDAEELSKGAYVLADFGGKTPELILMASGSEVNLILKAAENLAAEGLSVRWSLSRLGSCLTNRIRITKTVFSAVCEETPGGRGWYDPGLGALGW